MAGSVIGLALLIGISYSLVCFATFPPLSTQVAGASGMEEVTVESLTWGSRRFEHCAPFLYFLFDLIF